MTQTAKVLKLPRRDDYRSTVAALGGIKDKSEGLYFQRRRRLTQSTLEALYEQNALVARICDLKVQEAFRTPWTVTKCDVQIDANKIKSDAQDMRVNETLTQVVQWGNLYGGAVGTIPILDRMEPKEPVNPWRIYRMFPMQAHAAPDVIPMEMDVAFGSRTYNQVLTYDIYGLASNVVHVHHSRLVTYEPIKLPLRLASRITLGNNGWGPSIIERVWDAMGMAGASKKHAAAMMHIASIMYVKMHGYREAHGTDDGREKLQEFFSEFTSALTSMGVAGLDKEDDIGSISLAVTGLHELIDRFENALVSFTDMPREILLNESPAGLNAGQLSGPQEIWFGKVQSFREQVLAPMINRWLELYFAWKHIPAKHWEIAWDPLWVRSESDEADIAAKNAATDTAYVLMGATDGREVRRKRFVEGQLGALVVSEEESGEPLDLGEPSEADITGEQQPTAAPVTAPEGALPVAEQALNGAQVASLMEIVQNVVQGLLPRDAAIGIIGAAFPSQRGREALILGSAGMQPVTAPAAPGQPAAAPAVAPEDAEGEPVQAAYEPPAGEVLMTATDLAKLIGVSAASIRNMHRRQEIGGWQIGGRWRFARSEILQAAHRPKTPAEPESDE